MAKHRPQTVFNRRSFLNHSIKAVALATTAAPYLRSQAFAAGDTPSRGGTLKAGLRVNVGTMDTHIFSHSGDADYNYNIYDRLVAITPKSEAAPQLAESWELPDDKTMVFKLRKGVKFHDGTPCDAAAVKFNIERILNPNTGAFSRAALQNIAQVEVIDETTFKFVLKKPDYTIITSLGEYTCGIISPTALEKWGKSYPLHPVGTGPFRFVEYVSDDRLILERNPDYWERDAAGVQRPYVDRVEYKIIPDETVRLANIESGTLDVMTVVPQKDVKRLRASKSVVLLEGPGRATYTLRLNNAKPPFNNVHLRRAIAWAIDRTALRDAVFFGVGVPAVNVLTPAQWALDPDKFKYVTYGYDPEKARKELQLGGKPNGFEFQLDSRNQPSFIQFAQSVAAQLSVVGINAKIAVKEQVTSMNDMRASNFEMSLGREAGAPDPVTDLQIWYHCGTTNLLGPFCNPEFDRLVDTAATMPSVDKRKELLAEAANILNNDAVSIFVVSDIETAVMTPKLKGYVVYGHGKMLFHNVWIAK